MVLSAAIVVFMMTLFIHRPLRGVSWILKGLFFAIFVAPLAGLGWYIYMRWERDALVGIARLARSGFVTAVVDSQKCFAFLKARYHSVADAAGFTLAGLRSGAAG
jgi:hypothetical protein